MFAPQCLETNVLTASAMPESVAPDSARLRGWKWLNFCHSHGSGAAGAWDGPRCEARASATPWL